MQILTRKWLHGLGAAFISGGAACVTSGLVSMGFAPDKFNVTNANGIWNLLALIGANFFISGILGAFLYLRQSPLPPDEDTPEQPK